MIPHSGLLPAAKDKITAGLLLDAADAGLFFDRLSANFDLISVDLDGLVAGVGVDFAGFCVAGLVFTADFKPPFLFFGAGVAFFWGLDDLVDVDLDFALLLLFAIVRSPKLNNQGQYLCAYCQNLGRLSKVFYQMAVRRRHGA